MHAVCKRGVSRAAAENARRVKVDGPGEKRPCMSVVAQAAADEADEFFTVHRSTNCYQNHSALDFEHFSNLSSVECATCGPPS